MKMTALMILITLMNSAYGKASDLFGELTYRSTADYAAVLLLLR